MALFEHPFVAAGSDRSPAGDTGRLIQMITGYMLTQVVRTAAELRIADHLHPHGATAAQVAEAGSLHPDATFRFLRTCASLGLATSHGNTFTSTPLLATLRTDTPNSLRDLALWGGTESHWLPWGRLTDAIRTGTNQTHATLGAPISDWLQSRPKDAEVLTNAVRAITRNLAQELADVISLRGVGVAVDVGGASGDFIQTLMRRHRGLTGIVLDLPRGAAEAQASAVRLGVADRFSFVCGDFFEGVPPGDVHLLKFILRNWDDDACVRILRNCRKALRPGGRVLVMELIVDDVAAPGLTSLMDLNVLTLTTGRERSTEEFASIFQRAGLELVDVMPSASLVTVLEAVPG
ncbi:methyltransferase [Streptomyces sp. WMMC500]|uniref:methyltransferase n=1 Tax=Streptomyces sp. WMMC500 TaxID=3015154 RepID=UPI00248C002A|nr:methyltransferase [Streptomyces sp. WMMC500]WBB62024.1 methyltransferase [Streptomyces sp. WMMC500]